MNVRVRAWLENGSVDEAIFARLVEQSNLGFAPESLRIGTGISGSKEYRFERKVRFPRSGLSDFKSAKVIGSRGEKFALTGFGGQRVDQLLWDLPKISNDLSLVEEIARIPGFRFAYLYASEDVFWQSETSLNAYQANGRKHEHLPKISGGGFFPWESESIDVSSNPGRERVLDGLLLLPASTMWFGPPAFRVFDRKRLVDFGERPVVEYPDGVVKLQLFPFSWYKDRIPVVRKIQERFASWMNFDSLESGDQESKTDEDPVLEFNTRGCSHGGVRVAIEWLDESGRISRPKSVAARVRVTELGPDGDVVYQEDRRLNVNPPHDA